MIQKKTEEDTRDLGLKIIKHKRSNVNCFKEKSSLMHYKYLVAGADTDWDKHTL